jgi:acyl carrier protein
MTEILVEQLKSIIEQLKSIIVEELDVNIKVETFDGKAPLFEGGLGMDSIEIVEFILIIEERFNIQFSESELNPNFFRNLDSLAKLIATKTVMSP